MNNKIAQRLRDRNTPYGWASLAETAAVEIDKLEAEVEHLRALLDPFLQMAKAEGAPT